MKTLEMRWSRAEAMSEIIALEARPCEYFGF